MGKLKGDNMKIVDYIYFNIYRWYYQMKTKGRRIDPALLTAVTFGLCFGGWFFFVDVIYHLYAKHSLMNKMDKFILIAVAVLFAGIINEIYSSNDRYAKVHDKYVTSGKIKDKNRAIIFSFLFIYLPYIILLIAAIISFLK
jgi:hypothetical protein